MRKSICWSSSGIEEEFLEHYPRVVQRVKQAAERGAAVLDARAWPRQAIKIDVNVFLYTVSAQVTRLTKMGHFWFSDPSGGT